MGLMCYTAAALGVTRADDGQSFCLPTAPPARARRLIVFGLKLMVSAGLLAWLFQQTAPSRLLAQVRDASPVWVGLGLALYFLMIVASAWRWRLLLRVQHVEVPGRDLVSSFLVATFFNNFLPSNIGGDVIRIRDTAGAARSKTMASLIVLVDRLVGLLGLLFVAAVGGTVVTLLGNSRSLPIWLPALWIGFGALSAAFLALLAAPGALAALLRPLGVLRREWARQRVERMTGALAQFRKRPRELLACFLGAVMVQAVLVLFYLALARSVAIPVGLGHMAVLVPLSFVVQMLPVSVNGFGVREATFSYYFATLHLPIESALVLSFLGVGLTLVFSLSGAVIYLSKK
jgi:uncharacterized protein (TIRG00374 family)